MMMRQQKEMWNKLAELRKEEKEKILEIKAIL